MSELKKQLVADEWRVAVFWECATRNSEAFVDEFSRLRNWIEFEESGVFETRFRKLPGSSFRDQKDG